MKCRRARCRSFCDQRRWVDAGEIAYASLARGTLSAITMMDHLAAIRMHARITGDFDRARALLEVLSGVRWDATGQPVLREEGSPVRDTPIALADILLAGGQEQEGRRLLAAIIARMRQEMGTPGHPEIWYYAWHPIALALNGEPDAAIEMLQAQFASKIRMGCHAGAGERAIVRRAAQGRALPGVDAAAALARG